MFKRSIFFTLIPIGVLLVIACAAPPTPPRPGEPIRRGPAPLEVFGAFATPIEEPWDGVIHSARLIASGFNGQIHILRKFAMR